MPIRSYPISVHVSYPVSRSPSTSHAHHVFVRLSPDYQKGNSATENVNRQKHTTNSYHPSTMGKKKSKARVESLKTRRSMGGGQTQAVDLVRSFLQDFWRVSAYLVCFSLLRVQAHHNHQLAPGVCRNSCADLFLIEPIR